MRRALTVLFVLSAVVVACQRRTRTSTVDAGPPSHLVCATDADCTYSRAAQRGDCCACDGLGKVMNITEAKEIAAYNRKRCKGTDRAGCIPCSKAPPEPGFTILRCRAGGCTEESPGRPTGSAN